MAVGNAVVTHKRSYPGVASNRCQVGTLSFLDVFLKPHLSSNHKTGQIYPNWKTEKLACWGALLVKHTISLYSWAEVRNLWDPSFSCGYSKVVSCLKTWVFEPTFWLLHHLLTVFLLVPHPVLNHRVWFSILIWNPALLVADSTLDIFFLLNLCFRLN